MEPPKHLRNIAYPIKLAGDNLIYKYHIKCICMCEQFILFYPGNVKMVNGNKHPTASYIDNKSVFRIKIRCKECNSEYILFDKYKHGWDGYICRNEMQDISSKLQMIEWDCQSCYSCYHSVDIELSYISKNEFLNEVNGDFSINDWPDSFDWIWISIKCNQCLLSTEKWIDYETA